MKDTLGALRHRLDPHRIARDAVEGLVDQGTEALHSGVETVKRNRVPLIGAGAFLAAFFNRKRLSALIWRKRTPKSKKASGPETSGDPIRSINQEPADSVEKDLEMTDPKTPTESHGKLRDGIDTSREKARDAARQTVETIESNPIGVIVGGLALGALVAAVIPRSQREKQLLAPVGKRVGAAATAALAAAKDAGKAELAELGISRTAAKGQVKSLFDGLMKAASTAGSAAAQAGKEEVKAR